VYNILSLIANGARGITQQEILAVLGQQADELEILNRENVQALNGVNRSFDNDVKVTIANGIFFDRSAAAQEQFARLAAELYKTEIAAIDLSNKPGSLERINLWCRERTLGLVPNVLDKIGNLAALIALNAIYFYGKWLNPFEAENTLAADFFPESRSPLTVKMMRQTKPYFLSCRPSYKAIKIPYAGRLHELMIFLPNQGVNVKSVLSGLNSAELEILESGFESKSCNLKLPKVVSENLIPLKETLVDLGINSAFESHSADFSGLLNFPTYFSNVFQKSVFELNEKGTEAAAVTVIEMSFGSAFPFAHREMPTEFNVNRSFLFALRDRMSGVQLFNGIIHEPLLWSA
jgi:serpin B